MMRLGRVLAACVVAFAAQNAACTGEADTCAQLERHLSRCGIPTESLECSRVERADQEALVALMEERGCSGLATENDRVLDARVCRLGGFSCPGSPIPAPGPRTAKHPIVLVSGIDGSPMFDWNPRIVEQLRADTRLDVRIVHVLPWATTSERAADLYASLESLAATAEIEKVNLVCYAVGGLDCRYLVSPGGLFAKDEAARAKASALVASITTVATPHRGTQVADATLSALRSGEATALLRALSTEDDAQKAAFATGTLEKTLDGLTPRALALFNQTVVDAPGITYQSFAGVSTILGVATSDEAASRFCRDESGELAFFRHPDTRDATNPLLWVTTPFAKTTLDDSGGTVTSPADGMVSIESAKWGTFRGCLPADHYDVIGQVNRVARDPQTGFDPVDFYRWLAADLGEQGL